MKFRANARLNWAAVTTAMSRPFPKEGAAGMRLLIPSATCSVNWKLAAYGLWPMADGLHLTIRYTPYAIGCPLPIHLDPSIVRLIDSGWFGPVHAGACGPFLRRRRV